MRFFGKIQIQILESLLKSNNNFEFQRFTFRLDSLDQILIRIFNIIIRAFLWKQLPDKQFIPVQIWGWVRGKIPGFAFD